MTWREEKVVCVYVCVFVRCKRSRGVVVVVVAAVAVPYIK